MANKFSVSIVTQSRLAFEGEAEFVSLPGQLGQFAIMSGHMPLIASLEYGLITIKNDNDTRVGTIFGGFAEVVEGAVTVLAQDFQWPNEIDPDRARRDLERAQRQAQEATTDLEAKRAKLAIDRANLRLEVSAYDITKR